MRLHRLIYNLPNPYSINVVIEISITKFIEIHYGIEMLYKLTKKNLNKNLDKKPKNCIEITKNIDLSKYSINIVVFFLQILNLFSNFYRFSLKISYISILLFITDPPVITVNPLNATVNTGDSVLLYCDYVANPATLKSVVW